MIKRTFLWAIVPFGCAAAALLSHPEANGQVYSRVVASGPETAAAAVADPLLPGHCGPRECRARTTTYGYYQESWRRWPVEAPRPLAHDLAPFVKPPRDVPRVQPPPPAEETSSVLRPRNPVRVDPQEVLQPAPSAPAVVPERGGAPNTGSQRPNGDSLPDLFLPETDAESAGTPSNDTLELPEAEQPLFPEGPSTNDSQDAGSLFPEDGLPDLSEPTPGPSAGGETSQPGGGEQFNLDILDDASSRSPQPSAAPRLGRNPLRSRRGNLLAQRPAAEKAAPPAAATQRTDQRTRQGVVPAGYTQRAARPLKVRPAASRVRNPLRRGR